MQLEKHTDGDGRTQMSAAELRKMSQRREISAREREEGRASECHAAVAFIVNTFHAKLFTIVDRRFHEFGLCSRLFWIDNRGEAASGKKKTGNT